MKLDLPEQDKKRLQKNRQEEMHRKLGILEVEKK